MATISDYTRVVKKERPLLADIVDQFGELDLLSFSKELFKRGEAQSGIYRSEFIDLMFLTFPDLSKEILDKYNVSLRKNPIVSTADHQCIINHPVYLNSNILLALFSEDFSCGKKPYITPPILSFSGIPLNNAAYPRGILLSTPQGEKRFSFFGTKDRRKIVYSVNSLLFSETQIDQWVKNNEDVFSKKELGFIKQKLLEVSNDTRINSCISFSEQTIVFNDWLWEKIFPDAKLNFFPIDELSKNFFSKVLIKNKEFALYKFLFDFSAKKQDILFNSIYGAWDLEKLGDCRPGGGTCFFWGINKEKRMLPLKREGNFLKSLKADFKPIKWNPNDLAKELENKRIMPSILMNYLVIAGHYGLYCSGAFNQISYLSPILKQYRSALLEMREREEASRVGKILDNGVHAFLYFLFGESEDKVIPLCSFNILQEGRKHRAVADILKNVTLKKAFEVTAPLIFPFITDPKNRDRMNFSFEDVYSQLKGVVPKNLIIKRW